MNRGPIKPVLFGALLGAFFTIGLLAAAFFLLRPNMNDILPAPEFSTKTITDAKWQLLSLKGVPVNISSGKSAIFMNYWATWCAPCVAEMPSIQRLYERLKHENIVFACVSNEELETVREFVAQKRWTIPVYVKGKANLPFPSIGVPTTIIVSKNREVVYHRTGAARWDSQEALDFFDSLLHVSPTQVTEGESQ